MKYLGLVIEKDDEYEEEEEDTVKRQYVPIRDRYIAIVKHCRKVTIESFEKRSRKDMRRLVRNLRRIGEQFTVSNI